MPSILRSLPTLLLLGVTAPLEAQQDSTTTRARPSAVDSLQTVRVTVTRDAARSPLDLPFALTTAPVAARPALRRTSVSDLLLGVPGVQVQDRANPSQDPRIVVRGFGARSAFGTRGVKVLRDGIPLSLPDGQTPLDWLDLETIDRVDVVRGTAAALYGNAAGGVIDLRSREAGAAPFGVQARAWEGGGLRRAHLTLSGSRAPAKGALAPSQWLAAVTRTRGEGARQWSALEATSLFSRAQVTAGRTRLELQGTYYDAPRAENTGALTAAELARDVRLPDSLNITKRSRKAVQQGQLALLAERPVAGGLVRASVFAGTRTLDNPLPFAIVAVDRAVVGGGIHGAWRSTRLPWPVRASIGGDIQQQADARFNYENCADLAATAPLTTRCPARVERGAVRLNQRERAVGIGGYARLEAEAPRQLFASVALRVDEVRFRVQDQFITATNADDSGARRLHAASPMLGLVWRPRATWSGYLNLSTAFETPTITELTNQESGAAGLNRTLAPQRTRTVEVGSRALLADRVLVDAALFSARVTDELVAFDVPNQPGRRAFRNAGQTSRTGAEVSARAVWPHGESGVALTWSRFRFDRYQVGTASYAGNPIPGAPRHFAQAFTTARWGQAFVTTELVASARVTADDAALVTAAAYSSWTVRAGLAAQPVGAFTVAPVLAVENLTDARYATSVVINATRGRSFEPGLPRRVALLMQVGWR